MKRENPGRMSFTGFSLIEVLVALLVLSIGLLGLAALQTTGLTLNHESYGRTQAVLQAYDIIDRIRANKSDSGGAVNSTYDSVTLGAAPGTTDCTSTTCTGTRLAEYDIRKWNAANTSLLANGKGAICKGNFSTDLSSCSTTGSIYRIAITWKEKDLDMRLDVEAQP